MAGSIYRSPGVFWALCLTFLLAGCSASKDVSLTQDEFQSMIAKGFPSPQIVTVDLLATARATLYLQTPEVTFADSRTTVNWVIPGEVDVDFAGKFSSGSMSLVLKGSSELKVDPIEQAVFLENVKISSRDIAVKSDFVQMLVLDALADIVAKRLDNLLLLPINKESPLVGLVSAKGVKYQIEPSSIVFSASSQE